MRVIPYFENIGYNLDISSWLCSSQVWPIQSVLWTVGDNIWVISSDFRSLVVSAVGSANLDLLKCFPVHFGFMQETVLCLKFKTNYKYFCPLGAPWGLKDWVVLIKLVIQIFTALLWEFATLKGFLIVSEYIIGF